MTNENDTQWEDMNDAEQKETQDVSFNDDYAHSYEDSDIDEASDEYSDDSDETEDEFYDDDESDDDSGEEVVNSNNSKKTPMMILLALIVVLLIVGAFLAVKLVKGSGDGSDKNEVVEVETPKVEVVNNDNPADNSFFEQNAEGEENNNMLSVAFNENGDGAVVSETTKDGLAVPSSNEQDSQNSSKSNELLASGFGEEANKPLDNAPKSDNGKPDLLADNNDNANSSVDNSIVVSWNRVRQNPFKPPVIKQAVNDKYEKVGDVQFEIIEPPTQLVPDQNLSRLLQTQISGILYDDESPSAIVNLAGQDQFVKVGDIVSGYKIKSITKTKVEISYKNNTYVASVGELFAPGKLEAQSAVSNLNNKFAGRYKSNNVEE